MPAMQVAFSSITEDVPSKKNAPTKISEKRTNAINTNDLFASC